MNIGIIFGGKSFEHEISVITAYQVKKKLEEMYKISMLYVDINGVVWESTKSLLNDYKIGKPKLKKLNINKLNLNVIVGCMHGENGEDGYAYNFARINNIKYFGTKGFGSSICMDKYKSFNYLTNNGIKMIDTYVYTFNDYLTGKLIENFPVIVKPIYGGSSLGVVVIKNKDELVEGLIEAFTYTDTLVVQPFIEQVVEYNMALTEEDYSVLERINHKSEIFSYQNKYSDSFKLLHQELTNMDKLEEFKTIGRRVYEILSLNGIVRIDFFLIDDEIYVNEINTTPGALSIYLFDDFMEVFNKSLNYVLKENYVKYKLNYSILKNSNINK
jgi:D-alanine-D-alanine ligase